MGKNKKSKNSKIKSDIEKEINYSISLKLSLIVVFLSIFIIFAVSFTNLYIKTINEEKLVYRATENSLIDFANSHAFLKTIEEDFDSYEELNDTENLQNNIMDLQEKFNDNTTEISIIKISINKPDEGELLVYTSTDKDYIGNTPNPFNKNASAYGLAFYIADEEKAELTIISPINISGNIVGTYEIILSMPPEPISYEEEIKMVILISVIGILILVVSLLYLLRKVIVGPITTFKETAKIIGKGKLDTEIKISSRDEIGDLAVAFNEMAKDLKKSRDKIEEYNRILEGLLDQKDEFIGQLGHDLKNPLQPLVGLLPMLIEEEKDPSIKEALEVMNKNVEYMRNLIFDTLKLAKLRSSNIEFDFEDINLREISEEVVETQKLYLKERKIKIENKIDKDIVVEADKLRLSEVFKNLITNSFKYTPEKNAKLIIDAKKEGKKVTVSINDNGIGMKKEQLKKVFDEFYKADKTTGDYYSTGLGLSICKKIIEKHGGEIWVDSPGPDRGTTFYFTLKNKTKNN